jgi:hypothetical protein
MTPLELININQIKLWKPIKYPSMTGVYKNKEDGDIMLVKTCTLYPMLDGETNEPYNAFHCKATSVKHGSFKRVQINFLEWEKILPFQF